MNRKKLVEVSLAASAVVAALVYFLVVVPRIIYGSAGVKTKTVAVDFADLDGAVVVDVGKGCENVYLEPASFRAYVTDCWGNVHLVDGPSREGLRLVKSAKLADGKACGIDGGPGDSSTSRRATTGSAAAAEYTGSIEGWRARLR